MYSYKYIKGGIKNKTRIREFVHIVAQEKQRIYSIIYINAMHFKI